MQIIQKLRKESSKAVITMVLLLMSALSVNALLDLSRYSVSLTQKAQIAVFMVSGVQFDQEKISNEIRSSGLVKDIQFISKESAFETASARAPELKEIVMSGENPFPAYFLIDTFEPNLGTASSVKKSVSSISGVEEVRYEPEVFELAGNTVLKLRFYCIALAVLLSGPVFVRSL